MPDHFFPLSLNNSLPIKKSVFLVYPFVYTYYYVSFIKCNNMYTSSVLHTEGFLS